MKKILIWSIISAFFAALFSFPSVSSFNDSEEKSAVECAEKISGILEDESYAFAENESPDLFYSNAEILSRYRTEAILTYIESNPDTANAEYVKNKTRSFIYNGKTHKASDFRAFFASIYSDIFYNEEMNFNNVSEVRSFVGDGAVSLVDKSVSQKVLCDSISEKYAVSNDGSLWYYGENYLICVNGKKLSCIVCFPKSSVKNESCECLEYLLQDDAFFGRKKMFTEDVVYNDGETYVLMFRDAISSENTMYVGFASGCPHPVFYDFSGFGKKDKNYIEK